MRTLKPDSATSITPPPEGTAEAEELAYVSSEDRFQALIRGMETVLRSPVENVALLRDGRVVAAMDVIERLLGRIMALEENSAILPSKIED